MGRWTWRAAPVAVLVGLLLGAGVAPASAAEEPAGGQERAPGAVAGGPDTDKGDERRPTYDNQDFRGEQAEAGGLETGRWQARADDDPDRDPADPCLAFLAAEACAGEVLLYDWERDDFGIRDPITVVSRTGAVLSGSVWATRAGPSRRGAVVVVGDDRLDGEHGETVYWPLAAALAKSGYVVVTYEPQGRGYSDAQGLGPDAGGPARPVLLHDDAQDVLDFVLSTAADPYQPRVSRTGTSHADVQESRSNDVRTRRFPFAFLLEPGQVGLVGVGSGAGAASLLAASDPRVSAVVAVDGLCLPSDCPGASTVGPGGPRVPALDVRPDFPLGQGPYDEAPPPGRASQVSAAYSAAGVDTGALVIRGGTAFEGSFLPRLDFPATLRGLDLIAWYADAWFDTYVTSFPGGPARLRTDRWRTDERGAAVDPSGDGNLFSTTFTSRLDLRGAEGTACEDLRDAPSACPGFVVDDDGVPGTYGYREVALTRDSLAPPETICADGEPLVTGEPTPPGCDDPEGGIGADGVPGVVTGVEDSAGPVTGLAAGSGGSASPRLADSGAPAAVAGLGVALLLGGAALRGRRT